MHLVVKKFLIRLFDFPLWNYIFDTIIPIQVPIIELSVSEAFAHIDRISWCSLAKP
jgi:hypothetical protein